MLKALSTIAALTALAAPAAASEAEPAKAQQPKEVCKWIQDTQWRTSRARVCMTPEKWQRISRETREQFTDYNKGSTIGSY